MCSKYIAFAQVKRIQIFFLPQDEGSIVEKEHLLVRKNELFLFLFFEFFYYFLKIKHRNVHFLSIFHHAFFVHNF